MYSKYVADNTAYIMAGVGIVAGKNAFDFLQRVPPRLVWSKRYIALEDQSSEYAQMIAKWIADNKNDKEGDE